MKFLNGLDLTAADSEATRVTARANANNALRRGAERKDVIIGMRSPHGCLRVRLALSSVGPYAGRAAEGRSRTAAESGDQRRPPRASPAPPASRTGEATAGWRIRAPRGRRPARGPSV